MKIRCVWEHNGNDTILYSDNFIGAFTRGQSKEIALEKMITEVESYLRWQNKMIPDSLYAEIVQQEETDLQVCDADSNVIFEEEKKSLTEEEYLELKELALKSAKDFLQLYTLIPDKDISSLSFRQTFYGNIPRTANEMYEHTKNVNSYYFGEINVEVGNDGSIYDCRKRGFELLEKEPDYLDNQIYKGSYNEFWSLRKVLRRFIWHDRIHAKAMYRMSIKTFGAESTKNIFLF